VVANCDHLAKLKFPPSPPSLNTVPALDLVFDGNVLMQDLTPPLRVFGRILSKANTIAALPIFGILLGLIVYGYNEYKDNKKRDIPVIEEKLNKFYYPLQAQFSASGNEWKAFRTKYGVGRKAYFSAGPININGKTAYLRDCSPREQWTVALGKDNKYTDSNTTKYCEISDVEIEAWVSHIIAQYKGSKGQIEEIILTKRHLIKDDKEMIEGTDLLMLHFTGYRDVIKRWEDGDRSVMTSHVNFPSRLPIVINDRIKNLESELASKK
jgi:hypothetical protein